ncbi:MAG: hypothetical protein A2W19_15780 [Spirochaetes bacterium RBG_16_49_21]|nr:MAG: hypothetical protein A2W19_15780 [Spirochaetes bacterium RBG_16_49_21]
MDLFSINYFPALLTGLLLVFIIREAATYAGIIRLKYIFTPLITGLIIGFVVLSIAVWDVNQYRALILTALILSLIADTVMMIIEVNLVLYGIIYFMSAHIMYSAAFSMDYSFKAWNIIVAVILLVALFFIFMRIKGKTAGLDIPVLIYAIVIFVMLFFAVSSANHGVGQKSAFILTGAVLFVLSDLALAYFTFIRPYKHESVIAWALYAPGQLLIALSCFD